MRAQRQAMWIYELPADTWQSAYVCESASVCECLMCTYMYVDDKYAWVECAVQHCIRSIMVQNTRKSEQIHTALERQRDEGAFWRL